MYTPKHFEIMPYLVPIPYPPLALPYNIVAAPFHANERAHIQAPQHGTNQNPRKRPSRDRPSTETPHDPKPDNQHKKHTIQRRRRVPNHAIL